jgi:hypothetical protein
MIQPGLPPHLGKAGLREKGWLSRGEQSGESMSLLRSGIGGCVTHEDKRVWIIRITTNSVAAPSFRKAPDLAEVLFVMLHAPPEPVVQEFMI